MNVLTGKTALVTGGSRGPGRAVALRLAAEGALVAVHYGGNDEAAKETVARIEEAGGRAFAIRARFGEDGAVDRLFAELTAGLAGAGLDILVNNAGISSGNPISRVVAGLESITALGRLGEPEDVADVVGFLAGPQGRWVTGQTVDVTVP